MLLLLLLLLLLLHVLRVLLLLLLLLLLLSLTRLQYHNITTFSVCCLLCVVSEQALSTSDDRAVDVIRDVIDNDVDSLRGVFHALKIEPCRLRLVSKSPIVCGKNKPTIVLTTSAFTKTS